MTLNAESFTRNQVRDIGQSIPYPGAANTITVTLATNVPVTDEAVVSISGLTGGDAAPGILKPDIRNPKPETRNSKPETRNPRPQP